METTQMLNMSLMAFLTQLCLLQGYPASWRTYQPMFLPGPQYCPDTGRTVCTAVDYYPTDQIFHLLTSSRSQVFNLTSLFVDERKGDVEPNIALLPTPQPHYNDGYGSNQPPPGGQFSPNGYNNWNTPTSDKPVTGFQSDRWRQIGQNGNRHMSAPGTPRSPYMPGVDRQSRAQGVTNQRRTINGGRNPPVTQRFNYNERPGPSSRPIDEDSYGLYGNRGVTQHNRIEPQQILPYGNQQFGQDNFTRFHPQDVQVQDPYQIQPPQTQYGVKGHNPYVDVTTRPQSINNWKGSPSYNTKSGTNVPMQNGAPQGDGRFSRMQSMGRRERRNEDVEVACQVRSTYVPPRAALNDNSEWKYIVNVPERDRRFTQYIRVDICLNPGDPCSSRLSLPFGFESRCRQKYIKKKLLSLNADGQGTSEDNFFIPSCCVCEITRQNKKK